MTPKNLTDSMSLSLIPEDNKSGLEVIAVKAFPFLIGRHEQDFAQYKDRVPAELKKLSRRHAQIICKGDTLYIQDLGSTNGTVLRGKKLADQPAPLRDGDSIALSSFFKYLVKVDQPGNVVREQQLAADKTIYMSDASAFLDMLSSEEERQKRRPAAGDQHGPARTPGSTDATHKEPQGKKRRLLSVLLAEFRGAPGEVQKRKWYFLGAVSVLLVAGLLLVIALSSPERKLKKLAKEGRYTECCEIANQVLCEDPGNESVRDLATEALFKDILTDWTGKLNNSRFAEARELLLSAAERNKHNAEGMNAIGLLGWATDLDEYFSGRDNDTPLILFRDGVKIESLLKRWNMNETSNCSLLDRMSSHVPSFVPMERHIFSRLNMLKAIDATYSEAVGDFEKSVQEELDADRPQGIASAIEEFTSKHPKVGGIDKLREDLSRYEALQEALRSKQFLQLSKLLGEYQFQTQPFVDKVAQVRSSILPPASVVDAYKRASDAWSSGAPKKAIAILETMAHEEWGEMATMKLQHYRQVLEDFAGLENSRNQPDYPQRLLSFYSILVPGEDEVFIKLVENDFERFEKQELERSQTLFASAQKCWEEYTKGGGISGLLRLDTKVSGEFRKKAELLHSAFEDYSTGERIYTMLNKELPPTWQKLQKDISDEVETQRLRLSDLENVLDSAVVSQKLKLLPKPLEGNE